MTILFITDIKPFPVFGGEKIRSYGLINIISQNFDKVIAIIGKEKYGFKKTESFQNVSFIQYNYNSDLSKFRPFNHIKKFLISSHLKNIISKIIYSEKVDLAFIDYHYFGQYISLFKKKGIPVIYGTHNIQSNITLQSPAPEFKDKLLRSFGFVLSRLHEWYYFKKADALIAVSEIDKNFYKKFINKNQIYIIPNFLIESKYKVDGIIKENYAVMAGNFGAYQNSAGLKWFIENIWKDSSFNDKQLILAGIGSDSVIRDIDPERKYKNIISLGQVDDIKTVIAKARVAIVPLLHGSGTRLKCIEAMALKTQIIATSKGAEGVDHNGSIIISDSPDEFKFQLINIFNNKIDYTEKAYNIFMEKYSSKFSNSVFKTIINNLGIPNK